MGDRPARHFDVGLRPTRLQPVCLPVVELVETVIARGAFGVHLVFAVGGVYPGAVTVLAQVLRKRALDERSQLHVRKIPLKTEISGIDTGKDLEFGDPAAAANGIDAHETE